MNINASRLVVLVLGFACWIIGAMMVTSAGPRDASGAPRWVGGSVDALGSAKDPLAPGGADPETNPAAAARVVARLEAALASLPDVPPDGMNDLRVTLFRAMTKEKDHYRMVADPPSPESAAAAKTPGYRANHATDRARHVADVRAELEALGFTKLAARLDGPGSATGVERPAQAPGAGSTSGQASPEPSQQDIVDEFDALK